MPVPSRAPSVLSSWSRVIVRALEERGVAAGPLVEKAGLDLAAFDDPDARFEITATARLWRAAAEATDDPGFGLYASRFIHQTTFHALGYAVMASATLRDALERHVRYGRLVSDAATNRLETSGDRARFFLDVDPSRPRPADEAMDAMTSLIARTCRALSAGTAVPVSVALCRPEPPKGAEVWSRVFRAPVAFGAATHVLEFRRADLDARLPSGNADLARANEEIVARYLARFDEERVAARVRALLVERLSSGAPEPEAIARALGLSHRSLQRKLGDEGTSYKALLNDTRRELACAYLEGGRTSLTELTFLLGFSDTSTFARAFKRWTGVSPRSWATAGR